MKMRKARISDAPRLKASGLMSGSIASIEDRLRKTVDSPCSDIFVYKSEDEIALASFVTYYPSDDRAFMEFLRTPSSDKYLSAFLDALLSYLFLSADIYKVSCEASVDDSFLDNVFSDNCLLQEALLHDHKRSGMGYTDAGLFYITAPMYSRYNVCFVPFQRGVLAVYGGIDYVDRISFLSYGKEISDLFARRCADYAGLLDPSMCLKPRNSSEYDYDPADFDFMPAELNRAYLELREYFLKKRDNFDINIRLGETTEFQRKVWDEIRKIPYGVTVSYEDIALKLCGNDIKQARKLTRAVGAACGENPIPIIVPCHRVIGKNGKLVGFSGGIEFKDFLLQNELFSITLPLN